MSDEPIQTAIPKIYLPTLGVWNFYFLVKFILLWRGQIDFHPLENLAFASLLLLPAPGWLRRSIAIPVSIALFYYDSWLPPISRIWSESGRIAEFSTHYMIELLGRLINWQLIALLVICWVVYFFLATYVRIGVFVMAGLIGLSISQRHDSLHTTAQTVTTDGILEAKTLGNFDQVLQKFYQNEATKMVKFKAPGEDKLPFDLLFIHICSLSWNDLSAIGLDQHPLLKKFDYLFKAFNSASSYSGPAAIRLQRATCGQTSHQALSSATTASCLLMPSLRGAGFETQLVLNHDGHFDDFLQILKNQGLQQPMALSGLPAPLRSFDGSAIYSDLATLQRWQQLRLNNSAPRIAAYYNTISLHDGNYYSKSSSINGQNSAREYKERVKKLLDEVYTFLQVLEKSGQRTVLIVVPEHGAAFQGDKRQISGLREIASPEITLVPVGIKVLGDGVQRLGEPQLISKPSSYLALSHIIAKMLDKSPYGNQGFSPEEYLKDLPGTPFVSENEGSAILNNNQQYYLKLGKGEWKIYQ